MLYRPSSSSSKGVSYTEYKQVPGSSEGLVIGHRQAEHGIRPGPQLIIASIHVQLVSMHGHEVAVAGWGGMGPRGHISPLLLGQVQHKHVLQHEVVASTMNEQLTACDGTLRLHT